MSGRSRPKTTAALVGSSQSSGSSLFAVMLDAHPDVVCGPELSMFAHPFFWRDRGGLWRERMQAYAPQGHLAHLRDDWTDAQGCCPFGPLFLEATLPWYDLDPGKLTTLSATCEGGPELAEAVYRPLLSKRGKRVWVEKSPQNVHAFTAFLEAVPDGKVVYLTRDGRDVISSMLKKNWGTTKACGSHWLVETALASALDGHPRALRVRYEDLVTEPRVTMSRVLDFLDLSQDLDSVLDHTHKSSRALTPDASSAGNPSWTKRPYEQISQDALGKWKTQLSPVDLALFQALEIRSPLHGIRSLPGTNVRGLMERLGYPWIEPEQVDAYALEDKLLESRGFSSGEVDYTPRSPFVFHEQMTECRPSLLPVGPVDWEDRKLHVKLTRRTKELQQEVEGLKSRVRLLESSVESMQTVVEPISRLQAVRAARRLEEMPLPDLAKFVQGWARRKMKQLGGP